MGRIKSKLVKNTAIRLFEKSPEIFSQNFEENKALLGKEMPSKKIRNQIAGYLVRFKKAENKLIKNDAAD